MQAFVRVVESQSFSFAARQLGVTSSVITSRIKQLEHFVQAPLFRRSTRELVLSETGQNFIDEMRRAHRMPGVSHGPHAPRAKHDKRHAAHSGPANNLIERPLFPVRRVFCISPQYLRQRSGPCTPQLSVHELAMGYPSRNRWFFGVATRR